LKNNIDFWGMANKNENSVGRKLLFSTPEELQVKIDEYFDKPVDTRTVYVGADKMPINVSVPTITGLALFLGFESRQSFYDYEKRDVFSYTIKKARLRVEREYEQLLQWGNTTGAIFALKNLGWKDEKITEHKGGVTVGSPLDNIRTKLNIDKDAGTDE